MMKPSFKILLFRFCASSYKPQDYGNKLDCTLPISQRDNPVMEDSTSSNVQTKVTCSIAQA